MNKEELNDILGTFSLVRNPIILSEEELIDVQKAIRELQKKNRRLEEFKDWIIKEYNLYISEIYNNSPVKQILIKLQEILEDNNE